MNFRIMTQFEQVKNEIARIKAIKPKPLQTGKYYEGYNAALNQILSFIEEAEKKEVEIPGLNEAAKQWSEVFISEEGKDACNYGFRVGAKYIIEKASDWLTKHAKKYYFNKEKYLGTEELVEDFKLSMEM